MNKEQKESLLGFVAFRVSQKGTTDKKLQDIVKKYKAVVKAINCNAINIETYLKTILEMIQVVDKIPSAQQYITEYKQLNN